MVIMVIFKMGMTYLNLYFCCFWLIKKKSLFTIYQKSTFLFTFKIHVISDTVQALLTTVTNNLDIVIISVWSQFVNYNIEFPYHHCLIICFSLFKRASISALFKTSHLNCLHTSYCTPYFIQYSQLKILKFQFFNTFILWNADSMETP